MLPHVSSAFRCGCGRSPGFQIDFRSRANAPGAARACSLATKSEARMRLPVRSAFMMHRSWCGFGLARCLLSVTLLLALGSGAHAQVSPETPDIPKKYEAPTSSYDYVKREVMIPMRDGVNLHTVISVPRGASHVPIILPRTPYDASRPAERAASPNKLDK